MSLLVFALFAALNGVFAAACDDDASWHKTGEAEKTCAWVADFTERRCTVKGADGSWAYQACAATCASCADAACSAEEDSPSWRHASGVAFKDCAWVADFAGNRCSTYGGDGEPAFLACPRACGTCAVAGCADATTWRASGAPVTAVSGFTAN